MEWLAKSGIVGYVLAGISVITLAVFLERAVILHWERSRLKKGRGIMEKIAEMIRINAGTPPASLGELITFKIEDKIEQLSSSITFLRLASTISPLLGLLGTVIGMIKAFKQVSEMGGMVKPAVLASGIWVALLTTAEGLIVAIAAFLMYHYLQHLVGRIGKGIAREAEVLIIEYSNDPDKS
ncbi:MAG TPA: MotA/TolQ/ExbB proton channel family protein [Deltaproteobacteria bacterium]|nr:MotA/TolQ/ExbB proton channel family protein [Deltaproteobacteria bacterium]